MLMYPIAAFVLVVLSTGSGHGGVSAQRMPFCATESNPCRIQVKMGMFHGSDLETNGVPTCTCSPPYQCSSDWEKPGHVISRKVISTVYNITLQMMFCRPVEPKRLCSRRDVALVTKGSMNMPQDIASYNCRCRRRQPLVLSESSIGEDHLTYHTYVCANHKRACSSTSPCMTLRGSRTEYHCKCTFGTHCRTNATSWGEINYGYCTP